MIKHHVDRLTVLLLSAGGPKLRCQTVSIANAPVPTLLLPVL